MTRPVRYGLRVFDTRLRYADYTFLSREEAQHFCDLLSQELPHQRPLEPYLMAPDEWAATGAAPPSSFRPKRP
jgi:hypothetical protein